MSKAYTWKPGTNKEFDDLFEKLRLEQYENKSHRLWQNYNKEIFDDSEALTISFIDGEPEVCSSIIKRDCWPDKVYRIYNRVWKCSNRKDRYLRTVSPSIAQCGESQIEWLKNNTDYELYFFSRETDNWREWSMTNLAKYGIYFKSDEYKYLTCPCETDHVCWQYILYNGNEKILEQWKRQLPHN